MIDNMNFIFLVLSFNYAKYRFIVEGLQVVGKLLHQQLAYRHILALRKELQQELRLSFIFQ
jgi:hypothetical protein